MGILDFLFGRVPRSTDAVPDFDITIDNIRLNKDNLDPAIYRKIQRQLAKNGYIDLEITLPDEDDHQTDDHEDARHTSGSQPIDPVFCTIDYTDAAGNQSRRRITTRSVRLSGEAPVIVAICHERKALRHFRIDRISRIVTIDGEVFAAEDFVCDILGVDLGDYHPDMTKPSAKARRKTVNFSRYTAPAVVVLTAAANSDDELHSTEVEVIMEFLEDESFAMYDAGLIEEIPDPPGFDVIARRIKRIRPTREDLAAALRNIKGRPTGEIDRLKRAVAKVAVADGAVVLPEELFISELDHFFADSDTTAWAELDRLVSQS